MRPSYALDARTDWERLEPRAMATVGPGSGAGPSR